MFPSPGSPEHGTSICSLSGGKHLVAKAVPSLVSSGLLLRLEVFLALQRPSECLDPRAASRLSGSTDCVVVRELLPVPDRKVSQGQSLESCLLVGLLSSTCKEGSEVAPCAQARGGWLCRQPCCSGCISSGCCGLH